MADAVIDVESLGGEPGVEEVIGAETPNGEQGENSPNDQQQQLTPEEKERKSSREYQKWLNGMKETSPEHKPFINRAKDNESRLYALGQIEPRGIDGVRETYALLNSVQHGDLTGAEAVSALQDVARDQEQADALFAAGDPAVLDLFDEGFNEGLGKLAPHLLARLDPESLSAAIAPHMVSALRGSELVSGYNALVDVLSEKMPSWIPPDKQGAWREDWQSRLISQAAKMGNWLNQQQEKAGKAPQAQPGAKQGTGKTADPASERMKAAEAKEQDFHWKTNIAPKTDAHADQTFSKLFGPYDKRLKLDAGAKAALKQAFIQGVVKNAVKPGPNGQKNAYVRQMERYRGTKNPDPGAVTNFFKVEFDKHAKTVLDSLVNERYGRFLKGAPKPSTATATQGSAQGSKGPILPKEFVTVTRPADGDIDFKHPKFRDLRAANKFPLKNGKIAVLRRG